MSVTLEIHPSESLVMYGPPDTSSAYSLSGHVAVSLKSAFSFFERKRPARVLLKSVTLEFEGQSEIVNPRMGYVATRLCSITRELLPDEPIELSNEGHEDEPCTQWNIVFNLPIPGWLPATSPLGEYGDSGTRYFVYATAQFMIVEEPAPTPWSAMCLPFRFGRNKVAQAQTDIIIERFINAPVVPASTTSKFPSITYLVSSYATTSQPADRAIIPAEVLSKIQILASVPEIIDITDSTFPLSLRLRTTNLSVEECARLAVTKFSLDITQAEKCRFSPPPEYSLRFPVPIPAMQPPNTPLRTPSTLSTVYDMGLGAVSLRTEPSSTRKFSLFPSEVCGQYVIAGDNRIFANDATTSTWYTMDASAPFVHQVAHRRAQDGVGPYTIRTSGSHGPHFFVKHDLNVALTCTYDLPNGNGDQATETLQFNIPLSFNRITPVLSRGSTPPPSHSPSHSISSVSSPLLTPESRVSCPQPHAQALPAYSQLFDSNGDRKIDYSVPLPLYTPASPTPSTSSLPLDEHVKISSLLDGLSP